MNNYTARRTIRPLTAAKGTGCTACCTNHFRRRKLLGTLQVRYYIFSLLFLRDIRNHVHLAERNSLTFCW